MTVTAQASGTMTPTILARSVADGVTNTTVLITSATAAWVSGDQYRIVTTPDFPAGSYIATVSSATNVNMNVSATAGHSGQTLTITSEYVLANVAAAGTYTLHVDASIMAAGDTLELRCYQTVLTGGVSRVAYYARYDGAQPADDMIKISVPISNELTDAAALQFTLKQTAGTARAFPWKILKYA